MAKFIIDTTDNVVSKSMLEMILEEHLDYNVYVKEIKPIDEDEIDEISKEYYHINMDIDDGIGTYHIGCLQGFIDGYRKAKEE